MSNSTIPFLIEAENKTLEISTEVIDFQNMKAELLSILKDFLIILEQDIFSIENKTQMQLEDIFLFDIQQDFIKSYHGENIPKETLFQTFSKTPNFSNFILDYIKYSIKEFLDKYLYNSKLNLFNGELYSNIFSERSFSNGTNPESIKRNLEVLINFFEYEYKRQLSYRKNEDKNSSIKPELSKLNRVNPNIIGYIIIRSLEHNINDSKEHEFYYFARHLQNCFIFKGTGFEERLNDFFMKNCQLLPIEGLYNILETKNGEKLIEQLLKMENNNSLKLNIFRFIIEYHKRKYEKYFKEIKIECIKLIGNKTLTQNIAFHNMEAINLKLLSDLYYFYKKNINFNYGIDVEKAFEDYYDLYTDDDFRILNIDNFGLYNGELPFIYIKRSLSDKISGIAENIINEKEIRTESKIPINIHKISDLIRNALSNLPESFLRRLDDINYKILNNDSLKHYTELRKTKPGKNSHDAEKIRDYRQRLKSLQSPIGIRQRIYAEIIAHLLNTKYNPQTWPSIGQELEERKINTIKKRRKKEDNDLIKRLSNGGMEAKLGKPTPKIIHQGGEDARLGLEKDKDSDFEDDIPF